MQYAPVCLFVYNRPEHIRRVTEALGRNLLAAQTDVRIYADAAEGRDSRVEAVREHVRSLEGFKSTTVIERETHFGLARSILSGVTETLAAAGRVIVLEDDLVTAPYFLSFMNRALDYYEQHDEIFSVSGYSHPPHTLPIPSAYRHDVYLNYRPSSWGWATWADRWERIDWDVSDYEQFCNSSALQARFNRGGDDLTPMLKDQMDGRIDSWAIRFCYAHYRHNAYSVCPVRSYINNIGFDDTGTHPSPPFSCENDLDACREAVTFPDSLEIDREIADRFRDMYRRKPASAGRTGILHKVKKLFSSVSKAGRSFMVLLGLVLLCSSCTSAGQPLKKNGYLIIVPTAVSAALEDFAAFKESQGFLVQTALLEEILAASEGTDDPEKIRNYLIRYSSRVPEARYVLLVGSPSGMPMRFSYPDPDNHGHSVPTDFYYEDLSGSWDADGDGYCGEYGDDLSPGTHDYRAALLTGRIPWDGYDEIKAVCDSSISYQQDTSPRMQKALGAGEDLGFGEACDGPLIMHMVKKMALDPGGFDTTVLYSDCPMVAGDFELSAGAFVEQWERIQPGFVVWVSHGAPEGTTFIDIENYPQGAAPAIAVSASCSVASPDELSLARVLIRDGSCAAFLGASRWDYFDPFPVLAAGCRAATELLRRGRSLAEAKAEFIKRYARKPSSIEGWQYHQNMFLFMLYGDPSITVSTGA